jgi:CRISPR-associated protein (TIGR03986 family)
MPDNFKEITAPYNFVPLSGWIFQPNWSAQVSHDIPFSDGLSGKLDIEITAETPILVGNQQIPAKKTENLPGKVNFCQLPDNRYAIPGTSLKGMIRNVLEIASFGKMQFVDDRRLSIRDISTRGFIGNNYKIANQKAGFLHLCDDSTAEIIPCDFVHISHRDLEKWLKWPPPPSRYIFTKDKTFTVKEKYQRWNELVHQEWLENTFLPTISFNVNSAATPKMATHLGFGQHTGTLVFTGQISDKGQNDKGKYRDFVFYAKRQNDALKVSENILKDFFYIHGEDDKNSKGSWRDYWRQHFFKKRQIPVFYHVNADEHVKSIGLAYMYRLAYDYSIGETIAHTSKEHGKTTSYDLADLLFGKVHPDDQESQHSLKSRVSFGTAIAIGHPQPAEAKYSEATILNGPKATYFPNYVRQNDKIDDTAVDKTCQLQEAEQYRTYMQSDSEIRGWKRYPVRRWLEVHLQKPSQKFRGKDKDNAKVQVRLFPLEKGTQFKSTVHFHNLRPEELGALIWTLTWGGDNRLRHNLGMAKSFGFGQISLKIVGDDIRTNQAPAQQIPFDAKYYMSLFRKLMENAYAEGIKQHQTLSGKWKWGTSEQILQLKRMAYPEEANAKADKLKHMQLEEQLEGGKRCNQFVEAKQKGLVLPEYGGCKRYLGYRDTFLFPRTPK